MNDIELILTMLGEATTTKLHQDRNSIGFKLLHDDAKGHLYKFNKKLDIRCFVIYFTGNILL
jgi:hypothetical protein